MPAGVHGQRSGGAHHQPAQVDRLEPVDVLVGVDGQQRPLLVEPRRQRHLDEEGVDRRVGVEAGHRRLRPRPGSRSPAGVPGRRRCRPRRSPRASSPRSGRWRRRRRPGWCPVPTCTPSAANLAARSLTLGPDPGGHRLAVKDDRAQRRLLSSFVDLSAGSGARRSPPKRSRRGRRPRSPPRRRPIRPGAPPQRRPPEPAPRARRGTGRRHRSPPLPPWPCRPPCSTAISAAPTRDGWPAPMPTA